MIVRRVFLLAFASALIAAFGCSGGSDDNGGGTPPAIVCTDGGAAAANGVTLTCGGASDSNTEQVGVVMGGPASGTTTLRGLNFDVTYDPLKLDFVPAGTYPSALFPSALIAVQLANGQPGRVVVSIQEIGGNPDVAVGMGQHAVLTLAFARASGTTFVPTPLALENAEATDPSAAIVFSSTLALSYP
jgi:hypothetical protein